MKPSSGGGEEFVIARPRSLGSSGDSSPSRRISNQEERKSGNWDVTRSTQGHESGLGPLKYTNQTNGKDPASKLSVSSCVSWAKKFSVTGAAARPHTKDTKVTEATGLASQTLSFSEISLLRLKLARLPPRSA